MRAVSGTRWVAVGVVAAFVAVVGYFAVASIALDDGPGDSTAAADLKVDATGDAVAPFAGLTVAPVSYTHLTLPTILRV